MTRIALLLLSVFALSMDRADAQEKELLQEWRWTRFTTDDGLQTLGTSSIHQTSDGTIYLHTHRGLAWYDDYRWHPLDRTLGAPEGSCYVNTDRDSFYAVTDGKGFVGCRSFVRQIPALQLSEAIVYVEGVGTATVFDNRLYRLDHDTLAPFPGYDESVVGKVTYIYGGLNHQAWLLSTRGLYQFVDSRWKKRATVHEAPLNARVFSAIKDGPGIAYFVSPPEMFGVWTWGPDGIVKHERIFDSTGVISAAAAPDRKTMFAVGDGSKCFINSGNGWHRLSLPPLPFGNIADIGIDREGRFWVGSTNGLFMCRTGLKRWEYWHDDSNRLRNRVNVFLKDRAGNLWIGNADGLEIRRTNGSIDHITSIDGKKLYVVTGLMEDAQGQIWISSGSSFKGAYRWDGMHWTHHNITDDPSGAYFHRICKDQDGSLWFTGLARFDSNLQMRRPGVFRYQNGVITHYSTEDDTLLERVYCVTQGPDGSHWIATSKGICRLRNGVWTDWTPTSHGLVNAAIFSMTFDRNNRLWFCERNHGVGYIGDDDLAHFIDPREGYAGGGAVDVALASDGSLWFSGLKGLMRYYNGAWSLFNAATGLVPADLWPLHVTDDKVYIGSNGGGVAILDLAERFSPPPRLYPLTVAIQNTHAYLRWSCAAPDAEIPSADVQTRYRINEKPWSDWTTAHDLELADLAPGSYRFQVQAKGLFGNYDSTGQITRFTIDPPFYLMPGFVLSVGSSTFLVVYFVIRSMRRKRQHDRQIRISEAKFRRLTEATFEGILLHDNGTIIDMNESLQRIFGRTAAGLQGQSILTLLHPDDRELVASRLSADDGLPFEAKGLRADQSAITLEIMTKTLPSSDGSVVRVAAIRDITERKQAELRLLEYQERLRSLAAELSLTEERERRRMATYLHDSIGQTLAFCRIKVGMLGESVPNSGDNKDFQELRQTLDQSILDTRSLTFELSPPVLYELNIFAALEWLSEQFSSKYGLNIALNGCKPSKPLTEDIRILLFRAVREILMNTVKYADASNVAVSTSESHDGSYSIVVEDNGVGFDPRHVSGQRNQSFGLFSVQERLQYMGGTMKIFSEPGKGTRIVLTTPTHSPKAG